jgi:murein DD-endopeptidase MepM/ murein hydrolase activator NlpD
MRLRAIALVLLLAAGAIAGAPHHRHSHTTKHHGSPKILKRHLSSIQRRKHEARAQLRQTKHEVKVVRGNLQEIDQRLEDLEGRLESTEDRLTDSRREQKELAGSLAKAVSELDAARERARMRLRDIYMHGNRNAIAAFAGSTSYSDFITRQFINKRIADKDRRVFDDYDRLRRDVADRKARADRLVVRVSGLVRDQRSEQHDLQGTREEKGELLGQLRNKQKGLEQVIRELDEEESSIEAEIAAYQSRPGHANDIVPFTGKFLRPASGPITSGFGRRYHPILHVWRMHTGVDFGAPRGSPIRAAADGVVISAGYSRGYGNRVIIDHGGNISTLYGHCSRLFVSSGQRVRRGQRIAAVGSTGLATGPHLHFEVRVHGRPQNPMRWL